MKGMKKLFALLAVLTMALTLTPMVTPVAAADELKITLNTTSTTLYETATTQLKVEKVELAVGRTIELPTASVDFSWRSLLPGVAAVSSTTGTAVTVTGVATGTAMIEVTASYMGYTGVTYCTVVVKENALEIEIAPEEEELVLYTTAPNNTATVKATVKYNGVAVTRTTATWSVTATGLVTFSATTASVTKVTAGTTTGTGIITFTATYNGLSESATIPVTVKAHTYTVTVTPTSLTLSPGQTAELTPKVLWDGQPVTPTEYKWDVQQSGTIIKLEGNKVKAIANGDATITYTATYTPAGGTATVASAKVTVKVQPQTTILANAKGSWIEAGGTLYYQVKYDVINAPTSADHVELWYNGERLVEAALGSPISVSWSKLVEVMKYKAGMLTLKHKEGTSSVQVPVNFLKVTSTFKDKYVSGEPVNAATGTITAFDEKSSFTATGSTATFALVAVWKDANGNTHSATLPSVITATAETASTATFSVAEKAFRFIAPAGKVYLVPGHIADGLTADGKVVLTGAPSSAVFDIEKFAYKNDQH